VVSVWNALPEVVGGVGTIVVFKEHLDGYTSKMGIGGIMEDLSLGKDLVVGTGSEGRRACSRAVFSMFYEGA